MKKRTKPCWKPWIWDNVVKSGTSKICGRHSLKNLEGYGLLISSIKAQVAADLLKAPAILSETTLWRSAVEWEDLETYWRSEKSQNSQKSLKLF